MSRLVLQGQQLDLLPERAVFWRDRRTLLVADTHFGKDAHFRRAGIPIPAGPMFEDLERLGALADTTGAERLIVLGDFFHADPDPAEPFLEAFRDWCRARPGLAVSCVIGNHDRHGGYRHLGDCLDWLPDPVSVGPFALRHDPEPVDEGYVLAGHLHPVVRLQGPGGDRMRPPVFWFGARVAVLPSFGSFTGGARVSPVPGDRVFAVGPGGIVDVSPGEAIRHG